MVGFYGISTFCRLFEAKYLLYIYIEYIIYKHILKITVL